MEQPLNLQDAIFNLQKYLRAISFADTRVSRPPLDGIFDSATEDSVRSFQASRGLNANGLVDRATWDAIYEEYKALALAEELPFFPTTPTNYTARLGEESSFMAHFTRNCTLSSQKTRLSDVLSDCEISPSLSQIPPPLQRNEK